MSGPVGSADGTAVCGSAGVCRECRRKYAECIKARKSIANKGQVAIHTGYTPGYLQGASGVAPAGHGVGDIEPAKAPGTGLGGLAGGGANGAGQSVLRGG